MINPWAEYMFKYKDAVHTSHLTCVIILLPRERRGSEHTKVFIKKMNFNLNKKATSRSHFAPFPCLQAAGLTLRRDQQHEAHQHWSILSRYCSAILTNPFFFYLSWQSSRIVINCKCIKNSQGHFSMCIMPEKYYCLTGPHWQVKRGFIEGNSSSKQQAVCRKVIVLLVLESHIHLRWRLLPAPASSTPRGPARQAALPPLSGIKLSMQTCILSLFLS